MESLLKNHEHRILWKEACIERRTLFLLCFFMLMVRFSFFTHNRKCCKLRSCLLEHCIWFCQIPFNPKGLLLVLYFKNDYNTFLGRVHPPKRYRGGYKKGVFSQFVTGDRNSQEEKIRNQKPQRLFCWQYS